MNTTITRDDLYAICDTFEENYINKYISTAVEYIKQQIIEKAYTDFPNRSSRFLQRVQHKSYVPHMLQLNLPLSIPNTHITNYYLSIETINEITPNIIKALKNIFPDTLFSIDSENKQLMIDWR